MRCKVESAIPKPSCPFARVFHGPVGRAFTTSARGSRRAEASQTKRLGRSCLRSKKIHWANEPEGQKRDEGGRIARSVWSAPACPMRCSSLWRCQDRRRLSHGASRRFRTIKCWRKREQAPALQTLALNPSASGGFHISDWRFIGSLALAFAFLYLTAATSAVAQASTTNELVTLRQLKNLTPEQAAARPPVRVQGVVVCYDAGWHQLYLHDGRETLYFNADDFAVQPKKGDLVEITGRARDTNVLENPKLEVLGPTALPA